MNKILSIRDSIQARSNTFADVDGIIKYVVNKPTSYEDLLCGMDKAEVISLYTLFRNCVIYESDNGYADIFNNQMSFEWLNRQQSMKLIRMAMIGRKSSIPLFDILKVLTKEEILERLDGAKAQIEKGES